MRNKFSRNLKFRFWLLLAGLKQIRIGVWLSILIAVLGALNYEGKFIKLTIDTKFTRSINAILNQILLTYITGCIFYFLIEILYKVKKKIAVYSAIQNNVFLIIERTEFLINEIGKANTKEKKLYLNDDMFREHCDKINIDKQMVSVWFYPTYTFRQFLIRSCEEIKVAADEILSFSELFDEKWAYSLSKISGLSVKTIKWLDVRFSKPTIESYFLWGLYAEVERLKVLSKKYDQDYFKIEKMSSKSFHPIGLEFRVDREK